MIDQIKSTYVKFEAQVYALATILAVFWHYLFPAELVDTAE